MSQHPLNEQHIYLLNEPTLAPRASPNQTRLNEPIKNLLNEPTLAQRAIPNLWPGTSLPLPTLWPGMSLPLPSQPCLYEKEKAKHPD